MSKTDKQVKKPKSMAKEPVYIVILKALMAAVCLYSVVFWGSVTVVAALRGEYSDFPPPGWVIISMAAGEIVIMASVALAFVKRYIAGFMVNCAGTGAFLASAWWFVKTIRREIENRVVSNDLLDMDKSYAFRYFPSLLITLFFFILAVIAVARLVRKRRNRIKEKESAPVKSIID